MVGFDFSRTVILALVFGILALVGDAKAKSLAFSQIGARAIFQSEGKISYPVRHQLPVGGISYFVIDTESGQEWLLKPVGFQNQLQIFEFLENPDWKSFVRRPLLFVARNLQGQELDRTFIQLAKLLDERFATNECLGYCKSNGSPEFRLWAPTARAVRFFSPASNCKSLNGSSLEMVASGIWKKRIPAAWLNCPFQLEVEVFSPHAGKIETFRTTDPYSYALSKNSEYSVFFDPEDSSWMPQGWNRTARPKLESRSDSVLYELHVRDFSILDQTVPREYRGKFAAFNLSQSAGVSHLKKLQQAGITHIHLLPLSDFTSVEENESQQFHPRIPENLNPDSPVPQDAIGKVRALDGFNWGYDPFHYFVPDGSYAQNPDGGSRILEMREMIQSLHKIGLRVVMDVVFNHTFAAELARESVFDRIVPLYYYRLDSFGRVRNSSCCSDTESDRKMMEKLMVDSLLYWQKHFRIDGFRFDLMNLHSVETMERIKEAVRKVDPSQLIYGEAWNFGSLQEQGGNAFVQEKAYGRGIGIFNDRIRDAIRGGTTDSTEKSDQGYVTGLFYDFNHEPANRNTPVNLAEQRNKLLWLGDVIRIGMAGNLRDYRIKDHLGNLVRAGEIQFKGGPTGLAKDPEETINYVSAHDGYTLWDALQAKLPFYVKSRNPSTASIDERVDRQILSFGLIALSQGIPFFDSGIEILRSKSGDQNSYDSGDWFNGIYWDLSTNGWGRGLPPQFSNPRGDWSFWQPRLADSGLQATKRDQERAFTAFLNLLKVRSASKLFRLESEQEIQKRVHFLETDFGPMQPPGLIAMQLRDELSGERDLDPKWKNIFVLINVNNQDLSFSHPELERANLIPIYSTQETLKLDSQKVVLAPRSITILGDQ